MAGGVFTAANPAFTARELAYQLKDSGAAYLFVTEASLDTAVEAAKTVGLPLDRVKYLDADVLVGRDLAKKTERKGAGYWGSTFASEQDGKKYQWADLKGMQHGQNQHAPLMSLQVPMKPKTPSSHLTTPPAQQVSPRASC